MERREKMDHQIVITTNNYPTLNKSETKYKTSFSTSSGKKFKVLKRFLLKTILKMPALTQEAHTLLKTISLDSKSVG